MNRDQLNAFVTRAERRWSGRPGTLRLWAAGIIAIGYAGFLVWFLLLAGIAAVFFVGSVSLDSAGGLVLLVLGGIVAAFAGTQAFQLLWISFEPTAGYRLVRAEAPELFRLLSELRSSYRAVRVHQVLLTCEFNASVQQVPRFGPFGWPRNVLCLGWPLIESLSRAEFEAVLAHEFSHLSAKDGRFSTWVYRLRCTWERLFEQITERSSSGLVRFFHALLRRFVNWYWPRFHALTFLVSRAKEYSADQMAAERLGAAQLASALWRIECQSQRIAEKIWVEIWNGAQDEAAPPHDTMAMLVASLAVVPEKLDAQRWMNRALSRLTDNLDTHPSFTDRVAALQLPNDLWRHQAFPLTAVPSAAESLFGERLGELRQRVDAVWRQEVATDWRLRHTQVGALRRRLASFKTGLDDSLTETHQLWEKARLMFELDGPEAAEPLVRQFLAHQPNHPVANLMLGQMLLSRSDAAGTAYLDRVLERDNFDLVLPACDALAEFYQSTGQTAKLEEVHRQLSHFQTANDPSYRETENVSATDEFTNHDLSRDQVADLQRLLAADSALASAWLARKVLSHPAQRPLYVLCVRTETGLFGRSSGARDAALIGRLIPLLKLPGRVLVIAPQGSFRAVARRIMALPESTLVQNPSQLEDTTC